MGTPEHLSAMINIRVHLYGTLRRFSQAGTPGLWQKEVPEKSTIRDVMHYIGTTEREVAVASMNGKACPLDTEIPHAAKLILVTNIGGG